MMDDSEVEIMATLSRSSSLGDAVSGREQNSINEDDELYIPERRPSLDLGQSPMDTSHWHVDQAFSPAQSYRSMTSDDNAINISQEDGSPTRVELNRADSYSSCYSLDSDDCEKRIPKLELKDETVSELPETPELNQDPNEMRHPYLTVAFTFKAICKILGRLSKEEIRVFKMKLWKRHPKSFNTPPQGLDLVDLVDRMLECFNLEVSLLITKNLLEEIGQKRMIDHLQTLCLRNEVRCNLSETLKRKYGGICEDSAMQGERKPFDDVFTDLNITSTCDNGPNIEHEVITIKKLDSNQKSGELLSTKDIFSAERLEHSHSKLMLITGVAGSGKSMAVRRLVLDWIEERSHQHVSFLFPLPFRELKQFENSKISVLEIIQTLYPETKKLRDEDYRCDDCKIMFVFDGLDEYNGTLDFQNTSVLYDIKDPTTLNVIVVNLLRERLLYRSLSLVFSRPQVNHCIPWDTSYDEIDVRGFGDPQKDEYFKKSFKDPDQAARVIAYIDSSQTLRIMCHLPLFCSLVADEYRHIFTGRATWSEPPRSITYMYTKLLLALRQRRIFRAPHRSLEEERDFLIQVGKLAFTMLEQGQYKITKYDWKEVGINDVEVVINSGLCTQYITKSNVLHQEKVISFIHPTVQEYLAALYVFLTFTNQGRNIYEQQLKDKLKGMFKANTPMELYKSALDSSLQCDDGKLDIFLRFLLGMTLETNLELLQPFCTCPVKWPTLPEDAAALIRKRIGDNQHPARNSNLQRCLEELSA
ncbi:NLR family CARD domain-containing protein 3 [Pseudoliparis swirei]|uniref:NLR family CARD domain-containing protein 3 n=1 Tax=Pseudoliparis swirei TaxID=2059687 RepID=UPI0024BDFF56|nr:NLR family CARD domain-containing protein 3 [Pseudoliparis swirei]